MASDHTIGDVYLSCKSLLARVVSRIVPPHEIEDILQDTYVRLCQRKSESEIRDPRAFMVKTARNLALDHVKRAEYRLGDAIDDSDTRAIPLERRDGFQQAASDEEFGHFCAAVRELPQQCQRVFVLKKVYGYSQKEIAQELGLSESTVEKHIARGIRFCAGYMRQYREE